MGENSRETDPNRRRGPSLPLLTAGIGALLISAWALLGPVPLDVFAWFDFRWAFVVIAVVVGVVLLAAPVQRLRRSRR